jgi:anaerobic glycerol-3-phosphate dehydrogenase
MTQENLHSQNRSVQQTEVTQTPDLAKLREQLQEISAVSPAQLLNTMSEHFEHTAKTISEIDSDEKKAA